MMTVSGTLGWTTWGRPRPQWLVDTHEALDPAVGCCVSWPTDNAADDERRRPQTAPIVPRIPVQNGGCNEGVMVDLLTVNHYL